MKNIIFRGFNLWVVPIFLLVTSAQSSFGALTFTIDNVSGDSATQVVVSISANDFDSIGTAQGTIQFNTAIATYVQIDTFGLPGMSSTDFGTAQIASGKLTFAWLDPNNGTTGGVSKTDGSVVFSIRFIIVGSPGQQDSVLFTNTPTLVEFSDYNFDVISGALINGSILVLESDPCFPDIVFELDTTICDGQSYFAGGAEQTQSDTYFDVLTAANGCDSLLTTNLTVLPNAATTVDTSICDGQSYFAQGNNQTTNGTYFDTLTSANGCDSIITTNLTVLPISEITFNPSLCEGDSLFAAGEFQKTTGTYRDTFVAVNGCDSIIITNLTVQEVIEVSENNTICEGDSLFAGGALQTESGIYRDTSISSGGCDSIHITNLTVLPTAELDLEQFICEGDSFFAGGQFQTVGGIFEDTFQAANGCDSIRYTLLTVLPNSTTSLSPVICDGETFTVGSSNYTTADTYFDTLIADNGCDSIITTTLTVLPISTTSLTPVICDGETFTVGSSDYTIADTYFDTLTANNGCDSIITTTLTVLPVSTTSLTPVICDGETFTVGSSDYTVADTYFDTLTADNGCDSIITTTLTVLPVSTTSLTPVICDGETFTVGSSDYTVADTYIDTLTDVNGCDSIVTTTLTVLPISTTSLTPVICDGETFTVGSSDYTIADTYFDTLTADNGCDSIITTTLSVLPVSTTTLTPTICDGETFTVGSSDYTVADTYFDTLTADNGCDSIITTILSVVPFKTTALNPVICDGDTFVVGDSSYTVADTYINTIASVSGCDSIITTTLTVVPVSTTSLTPVICDGETFTVGSSNYTVADTYFDTLTDANGCDSIITTTLTVLPASTTSLTPTICAGETFTVGSADYTIADTYFDTLTADNGCDSIITTTLTVLPVSTTSLTPVICVGETFSVGSSDYTVADTYFDTLTANNGCDSIITTTLTVLPVSTTSLTPTICDGETFTVGSSDYTVADTYFDTLTANNGCDSIITTTLTVLPVSTTSLTPTICDGETFTVGSSDYTVADTYFDTLTADNGCDSIITTTLTVLPVSTTSLTPIICDGETFTVGSSDYTIADTYFDTLTDVNGCDSIITTSLTVLPVSTTSLSPVICDGETFTVGSSDYTIADTYFDTLTDVNGCDSIITTSLTVLPVSTTSLSPVICDGETFTVGSSDYTIADTYFDTLTANNGCDSIITTVLSVVPFKTTALNPVICDGDTFVVGDSSYTVADTYINTIASASGCDSIITTTLTVLPVSTTSLTPEICDGETFTVGSSDYTVADTYFDTLTADNGCDSIITTTLTVLPVSTTSLTPAICDGETFSVGSSDYTVADTYFDTLTADNGCDSIITTTLTVLPVSTTSLTPVICDGETFSVGSSAYTVADTYFDTLTASNGCDSIITTTLTVLPVSTTSLTPTICDGETFSVGSSDYIVADTYFDTLTADNGCDSIITTTLTVLPVSTTSLTPVICDGETFSVGSSDYTVADTYFDTLTTTNGCDSIITTTLTVLPVSTTSLTPVICDGEIFSVGNSDYTVADTYFDTLTADNGCDSIITTTLTVLPVSTTSLTPVICDGEIFSVGSSDYTVADTYFDTLTADNGCDSIITTTLAVLPVSTTSLTPVICDGEIFSVGSSDYTVADTYFDTLTADNGCDSIITITLTVLPVSTTSLTPVICNGETFTVGSSDYTTADTYLDTLTATNGCDSIITTTLTVLPVSTTSLTPAICNGETFSVGSSDYITADTYFDTLTAANGCDSIITTTLTVLPVSTTSLTPVICDGETFTVGSSAYTVADTYFDTLTADNGCDSVITTALTVLPVSTTSLTPAICNGETFTVGSSNYTIADTYFDTLTAANGCDSIITTTLTVLPFTTTTLTPVICDGEIFAVGSSNYTIANTYFDTLTADNGCDSIVTTTLTVLPVSTTSLTPVICDGETFTVGSSAYTTADTYFDTLTADNGCDSIITTTLTVLPVSTTSLTPVICDGEIFSVGSSDYTTANTYFDTLTAANGCDSIITTTLTVLPVSTISLTPVICDGETFTVGSSDYTTADMYLDTLTAANGCDSIITTTLTVLPVSTTSLTPTICDGETFTVGSSNYTIADAYFDTLTAGNGCDSIITTTLTVLPVSTTSLTPVICNGETFTVGTSDYTIADTYFDTLTADNGCDSIITTTLTVLPISTTSLTPVICSGDTFEVGSSIYTTANTYFDTLTAINGCDSIITTNLTIANCDDGNPCTIDSCANGTCFHLCENELPVWNFACQNNNDYFTSSGADCPAAATISLNVGDVISVFDTWMAGGKTILALSGCVTDNCTPVNLLKLRVTAITSNQTGVCEQTLTITFEAEDTCGNKAGGFTDTYTFTDDNEPQINGVGANDTIQCTDIPVFSTPTVADNCDATPEIAFADDTIANTCGYTITRTWTATDTCGNNSTTAQSIYVTDTIAPVWNFGCPLTNTHFTSLGTACPGAATFSLDIGDEITTSDTWTVGGFSASSLGGCVNDNCTANGDLVIRVTEITNDTSNHCQQVLTIIFEAEDACGNIAGGFTCTEIFIDDTEPQIYGVGTNDTIQCTDTPVFSSPTATDNCDAKPEITFADDTTSIGCGYIITRTWTAIDTCSNSATATQSITITDTIAPQWNFGCQATNTHLTSTGASCPAAAAFSLNVGDEISVFDSWTAGGISSIPLAGCVNDNCTPIGSLIIRVTGITDDNAGPCQQTLTITFEAEDSCGNIAGGFTCTEIFIDDTEPELNGVGANDTIQCTDTPVFSSPTATDNCDPSPELTFSDDTTSIGCGYIITRTWTATDTCNNSSTATQNITVTDSVAPVWSFGCQATNTHFTSSGTSCPTAAAFSLNVGDEITVFDTWTVGGFITAPLSGCVSDNCTAAGSLIIRVTGITDDNAGSCQQTLTITFEAEDSCGNIAGGFTCTEIFIDDTPPQINGAGANDTIQCTDAPVFSSPTTTDNCDATPEITFDDDTTTIACGYVITRTWTAIDTCNNSATATQSITVTDTIAPVWNFACQSNNTYLTSTGADCPADATISLNLGDEITIFNTWTVGGKTIIPLAGCVTDNCTPDGSLILRVTAITDDNAGICQQTLTITFEAQDSCGNIAGGFTDTYIFIDDNEPQINGVGANDTIQCTETPVFSSPTATDNCDTSPELTFADDTTSIGCGYIITRTWTATDTCSNSATATQSITVTDTIAPVWDFGCQVTNSYLTSTGALCPAIATFSLSVGDEITVFDTWTIGGISSGPLAGCVSDNCTAEGSLIIRVTNIADDDAGPCQQKLIITFEAEDSCGNIAGGFMNTYIFTDDTDPQINGVGPNDTIQCTETPVFSAPSATDNCDATPELTFADDTTSIGCGYIITRTWTASDTCSNSTTATQSIMVTDTTAPVWNFACQSNNTYLTSDGADCPADAAISLSVGDEITLFDTWTVGGKTIIPLAGCVTDNCTPDGSLILRVTAITDDNAGLCQQTLTITFEAEDSCGNIAGGFTDTYVFIDNTDPEINGVGANDTIQCTETPVFSSPTTTDNCDPAPQLTFSDDTLAQSCFYTITRTWTATDLCLNSSTASQSIKVTDTIAPVWNFACATTTNLATSRAAACPATASLSLHVGDEITISDTWTAGGVIVPSLAGCVSDNCTAAGSLIIRVAVITDDNAGPCQQTLTITFEAEDNCGNIAGGFTQTFIFIDDTDPQISGVGPNDTIQCTETPLFSSPTATDNCDASPELSFSDDTTTIGCGYIITRTWTVSDTCSNSTTATQSITVTDTIAPEWNFACQSNSTYLTSGGADCPAAAAISLNVGDEITVFDTWTVGGKTIIPLSGCITDNCTPDGSLILRVTAITDDNAGICQQTLTITFEAEDSCGNIAGGFTDTYIFIDDSEPQINGVGANDTIQCTEVPVFSTPNATDNCDAAPQLTFSNDTLFQSCFYTITRTWTATDLCLNSSTASQSIKVTDTIAPVWNFACQSTTTLATSRAAACPASASLSLNVGDEITVFDTWTAGGVLVPTLAGCVSDNCTSTGSLVIRVAAINDDNAGHCQQTLTITFEAEDNCGNIAGGFTQTYIFIDDTDPQIHGVGVNDTIQCTETPLFSSPTATDNCDVSPELTFSDDTTTIGCGYIITRTWTVSDTCSNSTTATQSITVTDTIAPEWNFACQSNSTYLTSGGADCPAAAAISLNVGDEITVFDTWTVGGKTIIPLSGCITDNCTPDGSLILRVTAITDDNAGICQQTLTITFEAEDSCGNIAGGFTDTYIFIDDSEPQINGVGANDTIQCTEVPVFSTPSATDNCDPAPQLTFSNDTLFQSCFYTITRTWTATDLCLNSSTASQSIKVTDTIAPVWNFACASTTTLATSRAAACPATASLSLNVGDEITVNNFWTAGGVPVQSLAGCVSDNCTSTGSIIIRVTSITDDNAGPCQQTLTITFEAEDNCGNISPGITRTYIFIEDTKPVISGIGPNTTIQCTDVPVFSVPVVTDNCDPAPVVTFADDTITGSCPNEYTLTRTWTAFDVCLNKSTATQSITLIDTVAPVWNFACQVTNTHTTSAGAECPSAAAYSLSVGDEITVFDSWTVGGVTSIPLGSCVNDNCTAAGSLIIRVTSITDDNVGSCQQTLTITFEAEDPCGNITGGFTCTDIFIDDSAPVINGVGSNDTIQCTDVPVFSSPTVTDNCDSSPLLTFTDDTLSGSCPGEHTIMRTWTAIDGCTNSSTATQRILISDTVAPVWDFGCQSILTYSTSRVAACPANAAISLNVGDEITVFDTWTAGGIPTQSLNGCVSDNCTSNGSLIIRVAAITDDNAGTCQQTLTVTFEAEDACGNVAGGFTQTYIFIDDTKPAFAGALVDGNYSCPTGPGFDVPVATDSCSAVTLAFSDDTIVNGCFLTITRTWTASDGCGNTSTTAQTLQGPDCSGLIGTCSDGDPCTVDHCDPITGACIGVPLCNDGNRCTEDSCFNGTCIFTAIAGCSPCDTLVCNDGNPCTTDGCDTLIGTCVFNPIDCNDNDACTIDTCIAGVGCVHLPALIIEDFTLVDAATNLDIQTLLPNNTYTVNICQMDSITIRANVCPDTVGSVKFHVNGVLQPIENVFPYAIAKDWSGNYLPWVVGPGTYVIKAAAYSGPNGSGVKGTEQSFTIIIVESPAVTSFTLVNAQTNADITELGNGSVIDVCPQSGVNIRANVCPGSVESVMFILNGDTVGIENVIPYALAGDNNGNYNKWNVAPGAYTLTAIPFSGNNASGTPGAPLTINITVVNNCDDGDPCTVDFCNASGQCSHFVKNCSDGDPCTTDSCDPVTGACVNTPKVCADTDPCTIDGCNAITGQCEFIPKDCSDGNPCTIDSCDPVTGACSSTPKVCDDLDQCTIDGCNPITGQCEFVPKDCSDSDPCTIDSCNPITGACINTPNNCDDGDSCTIDLCDASGNCIHTAAMRITGFTLVDADDDIDLNSLEDGDTILCGTGNFNIRAEVCPDTVGSVKFILNGSVVRIENFVPYAIGGDSPPGDYHVWNIAPGTYTITAIPYSNSQGNGTAGTAMSITIVVTTDCDDGDPCTIDVCDQGVCTHIPLSSEPDYLRVVNPSTSWRKLKLGYAPNSLWIPKQNVVAGGNDTLCITLRDTIGNAQWSKILVRPENNGSTTVKISDYMPAGGIGSSWTNVYIPLSAFPNVNFTQISMMEVPYSNGAAAFEVHISRIEFTGGATPFLWFGEPKTDNFHDGQSGSGSALVAEVVEGSPCVARTASKMSSENEGNIILDAPIEKYYLHAYPNPFNEKLNLEFSFDENKWARLEMYNITGERIAVLFDGLAEKGVLYKEEFFSNELLSGMFIYKLQTADDMYMGKVIFVR